LYIGVELVEPDGKPSPLSRMRQIKVECEQRNVLIHYTENVLILMPPLTISDGEVSLLTEVVLEALDTTARQPAMAMR
jgi:4-aminobutyrate aminotransferase-like enzyme